MPKLCPVCGETFADSSVFCPTDGTTLRVAGASNDLVGSVIADRYQVTKLLGEGGMGRVYLARHVRLPQQAAIKVLHPAMVQDAEAVARFTREAANAARIEHDRVARVFDFGEMGDGMVYIAMEFVPGRTLREILDETPSLDAVRAANLAYQVAEGLDAAHRIGIVHRDLKPDNILVITDQQGIDRCKVVDFGIAKAVDAVGTQLTRTGMIVGTPEYMSPEQVVGEAADARTDVYALALVTFRMLTGTLPFDAATHERALMSRLVGEPKSLGEAAPDAGWPEGLEEIFRRALHRNLESRTPSALEFADGVVSAVEAWKGVPVLRGRTPLAMPAIVTPTTGVSAGSVSPPASTVQVAPPPFASPPTAERAPVSAAPRRSRMGLYAGGAVVVVALSAWAVLQRSGGTDGAATTPAVAVLQGDSAQQAGASPTGRSPTLEASPGGEAPVTATGTTTSSARDAAPLPTGDPAPSTRVEGAALPSDAGTGARASSAPGVPEPPAPPPVTSTTDPARVSASALAARRTLDSVVRELTSERSGEREARAAVVELQRVLRDVPTAMDSAQVYLSLVSAFGLSGEPQRACNPLRSARRLARTPAQAQAVSDFFRSEALACVP